MTKHFSKELADVLAGPPKMSQVELAKKAKLTKSKMSRILRNEIACDQPKLQGIVEGIPRKEDKLRLINAYLQDVVGTQVLSLLHSKQDPFGELKLSGLSRKGQEKLAAILESSHLDDFERLVIDLARAFGL